uniref:Uncharacterized protein n=1 Tax=Siphoviridae sp. ctvyM23 TaxID=2826514 RepID=A0A8S5MHZ6_9CAUD|nr:MAG TPA: hypothetical protein [Siphoviridae sp. ctvyM23]
MIHWNKDNKKASKLNLKSSQLTSFLILNYIYVCSRA